MKIVSSIIEGIVLFVTMMVASRLFARSEQRSVASGEIARAAILAGIVAAVNCFLPLFRPGTMFYWMAPVGLGIMAGFVVYLMYWWHQDGSGWGELLAFVIVVVVSCLFTMKAVAWMNVALITSQDAFLVSLVLVIPTVSMVVSIGYFVTDLFHHRYNLYGRDFDRIMMYISGAATALILILLVCFRINWQAAPSLDEMTKPTIAEVEVDDTVEDMEESEEMEDSMTTAVEEVPDTEEAPTATTAVAETTIPVIEATWYKFYHYETLKNESLLDDFDFGLSAWSEGITAEQVMEEHFRRIEQDPALGAATFADFDVRLGLDFLNPGEHYDQNWSDGYWTTKINQCAVAYAADQNRYDVLVGRWENFVRTYAQVKLMYVENVVDQMYMVTLTSQNEWEAPEVIIATTDQPSGHILSYVFLIKGNEFEVPFRSDCGFQPTNVAEVMKETPKENPVVEHYNYNPQPQPTSTPQPKPGGKDDEEPEPEDTYPEIVTTPNPTSTPTPTPKKKKEPKDDPVNQGNAQKGGGDNRDDDSGEEQKTDPRDEHPTGSENDNNHGHSDPQTVTPTTPPVVEEHKQEEKEGKIVTDENPVNYESDPVTDRGPAEAGVSPTAADGDGEFVPLN